MGQTPLMHPPGPAFEAKIVISGAKIQAVQDTRLPGGAVMKVRPLWRRPYVGHAARVAAVATVIIAAVYVCIVAGFDVVERNRLLGQVDTRLHQRLAQAVHQPSAAGAIDDYDDAHDADDAPVFL